MNVLPPTHMADPGTRRGRQQDALLMRRYQSTHDPALREQLIERYMPLVRSLAKRYHGGNEALEDLVQVASVGLLKAIDRYEPGKGPGFVAYAAPTILGELRHHFRDHSWSVRIPRSLQENSMRIAEATAELQAETNGEVTIAMVAKRCSLSEGEVIEAMQADHARRTSSLDRPTARDEEDSVPMVEAVGNDDPGFDLAESGIAADGVKLRGKEREALHLRFHEELTQREIGSRIGVSQMQVSRLLRSALKKLLIEVRGGDANIDTMLVDGGGRRRQHADRG
jgi:RNA polymerase sigma-B factor